MKASRTGQSFGTTLDFATIKYDSAGHELWVSRYDGAKSVDNARFIAIDPAGNVYVTGVSFGSNDDIATVKYDSFGNELWTHRYTGPGPVVGTDYPSAIAVDPSGNVYVTGRSLSSTGQDYVTIKYGADSFGTELWVKRYNGPANGEDLATDMAIDPSGNVYVTGQSVGNGTQSDYVTIKYDPDGNQVWGEGEAGVRRYNGPANGVDIANAIAIDSTGNAYVTGQSDSPDTGADYATIGYKPDGSLLWPGEGVIRYSGPAVNDIARLIAVDRSGDVYVAGVSQGIGTADDIATIRYAGASPDVAIGNLIQLVKDFNLHQGIENSLDAKLENALASLTAANADNRSDAAGKLQAFINECSHQSGNMITEHQAKALVAAANQIVSFLSDASLP